VRPEAPQRPSTPPRIAGLDRLLRLAAARGATTIFLMSGGRPSVRVDGDYFRVPDEVADAYHRAAGAPSPDPTPDVKPKPRTARSKTTTEA
jgi:hypothetical protein